MCGLFSYVVRHCPVLCAGGHPCCLRVAEASVLRSCALVGSVSRRLLESVARRAVTHAVCLWQKRRCFGVLLRMLCGMFVPSAGFSNDLPPMLLALGRGVNASELCSSVPRAEATVCSERLVSLLPVFPARCHPCCLPVAEASVLRSCAPAGSVSWRLLESVARCAVIHAACPWQKRRCFGVVFRMLCGMFVPSAGFSSELPPMLLALGRGVGASEPCSSAPRAEATVRSSS